MEYSDTHLETDPNYVNWRNLKYNIGVYNEKLKNNINPTTDKHIHDSLLTDMAEIVKNTDPALLKLWLINYKKKPNHIVAPRTGTELDQPETKRSRSDGGRRSRKSRRSYRKKSRRFR